MPYNLLTCDVKQQNKQTTFVNGKGFAEHQSGQPRSVYGNTHNF